jgi:hypothetical protein
MQEKYILKRLSEIDWSMQMLERKKHVRDQQQQLMAWQAQHQGGPMTAPVGVLAILDSAHSGSDGYFTFSPTDMHSRQQSLPPLSPLNAQAEPYTPLSASVSPVRNGETRGASLPWSYKPGQCETQMSAENTIEAGFAKLKLAPIDEGEEHTESCSGSDDVSWYDEARKCKLKRRGSCPDLIMPRDTTNSYHGQEQKDRRGSFAM